MPLAAQVTIEALKLIQTILGTTRLLGSRYEKVGALLSEIHMLLYKTVHLSAAVCHTELSFLFLQDQ